MDSHDPQLLITLLATRMLGGEAVPATEAVFKGLKEQVKEAVNQGLLTQRKVKVATTTKIGRASTKSITVYDLSSDGIAALENAASPQTIAITRSATISNLKKQFEEEKQRLQQEVRTALSNNTKSKTGEKLQKEIEAISKKLLDLEKRFSKVEELAESQNEESIFGTIQQGFERLENMLSGLGTDTVELKENPTNSATLEQTLKDSYDELCKLLEFRDGLVKLPPLFYEAKRRRPELEKEEFHEELLRLWNSRIIELNILNEVYLAAEPELGIRRDDQLYYYIKWLENE